MSFRGDDRGVSEVIGFVLVLGILVLLLTINQAQIVPADNRATEFQHSRAVQNDMVEVRNSILSARTTGETTFAEVQLGTTYGPRVFAVNPPPPSGALRTGEARPITVTDGGGAPVSDVCPAGSAVRTRTLTYTPFYAEYDEAPTIVYENTVLYLQFDDRTLPLTGAQLVDGDTYNIVPINTTFSESSSDTVSVEPVPGRVDRTTVDGGQVTYPTGLSESTWEDLLQGQVPPEDVTVADGNLTIEASGEIEVACAPVGLNEAPEGGQRGTTDSAGSGINPTGPSAIELRATSSPNNRQVTATFNNTGDEDVDIVRARITFYNDPQGNEQPGPFDVIDPATGDTAATLEVLGPFQTLDPEITLTGNETETTVTFGATEGKVSDRDFFVVELVFDDGRRGTYFVDVP